MKRYGTTRYSYNDGCDDDGLDFPTLKQAKEYCKEQVKVCLYDSCAIWDRKSQSFIWEYGELHFV